MIHQISRLVIIGFDEAFVFLQSDLAVRVLDHK